MLGSHTILKDGSYLYRNQAHDIEKIREHIKDNLGLFAVVVGKHVKVSAREPENTTRFLAQLNP